MTPADIALAIGILGGAILQWWTVRMLICSIKTTEHRFPQGGERAKPPCGAQALLRSAVLLSPAPAPGGYLGTWGPAAFCK